MTANRVPHFGNLVANVQSRHEEDEDGKKKGKGKEGKPCIWKMTLQEAHELMGHPGIHALDRAAAIFGWELFGKTLDCDACAQAKARQKPVQKKTLRKANRPGERLFIDLSGPYRMSRGRNRYWALIVDDYTDRKFSIFGPEKTSFTTPIVDLLKRLKSKELPVRCIRMDNGTEWNALKNYCYCKNIEVEMTAPSTPQFNAKVERAFPTLRNKAHASLLASSFPSSMHGRLWTHTAEDATKMDNLLPRGEWANAYEPFGDPAPVKPNDLMPFGAPCWITDRAEHKAKFTAKAAAARRVGYADSHSSDTYVLMKEDSGEVVLSRDVVWRTNYKLKQRNSLGETLKSSHTTEALPDPLAPLQDSPQAPMLTSVPVVSDDEDDGEPSAGGTPYTTPSPPPPRSPPNAPRRDPSRSQRRVVPQPLMPRTPPVRNEVATRPRAATSSRGIRELRSLNTSWNDTSEVVARLEREAEEKTEEVIETPPPDPNLETRFDKVEENTNPAIINAVLKP